MVSSISARVLVALYWLADSMGLLCGATNEEIAAASGCDVAAVPELLDDLAEGGDISILEEPLAPRRTLVLMDHPEAGRLVRRVRDASRGGHDRR